MKEQMEFQRYVELYGEGLSQTDHMRWDERIILTNSGAFEVYFQDGFMPDKPLINDAWVWKIPKAEIDANPNVGEGDQK